MKTRAYVHSSNVVSARALEIATKLLLLYGMIWNQTCRTSNSRAYDKSNSLFPVKFCYILRPYLGKKIGYIRSKYVHLNAVITLGNNKQDKYSNTIHKIYLKPCHDHCFSLMYFQNDMKTHNDLARRLFTLKRLAFFPRLFVHLPITFAVCKFA